MSRQKEEPASREALRLCHFDPDTGEDRRLAPHAREECQTACYDCLMSYSNQPDHRLLSRHAIREVLLQLARSETVASPAPVSRSEHLTKLKAIADSDLERRWLDVVDGHSLKLPSRGQQFIEACSTKPDFVYDESFTVIYVDGPHHKYPDRVSRDGTQQTCLENAGYTVLRFSDEAGWANILESHPDVFGKGKQ
jgi:very-short-patch-repair endonuclease